MLAKHDELIKSLESPTFNPQSAWMLSNVKEIVDKSAVEVLIGEKCGNVSELQTRIDTLVETYLDVAKNLVKINDQLFTKLSEIDAVKSKLCGLSDCPETPKRAELQTMALEYLREVYTKNKIDVDYVEFCNLYAQFSVLRPLITKLYISGDCKQNLQCSVCVTEKVSMALVPCGHTFCAACAHKQRSLCFICRCTIDNRMKLYFN